MMMHVDDTNQNHNHNDDSNNDDVDNRMDIDAPKQEDIRQNNNNNNNDNQPTKKWWDDIPKGAEHIVKGIAAEYVIVDLLNDRLRQPRRTGYSSHVPDNKNNNNAVNFAAVDQLLRDYPALAHGVFEFHWDYYNLSSHGSLSSASPQDQTQHNNNNRDVRQLTILAMLCCLRPPLGVVQRAFEAHPAAIWQAEPTKGCLPFHYACTFEAPPDVLQFLLQQYPAALQRPRRDGMTPLHLASYFKAPKSIVEFLTNSQKKEEEMAAARAQDAAATTTHAPDENLSMPQQQQQQQPEQPQHRIATAYDSWTALHAAARGQAKLDVVQHLCQWDPAQLVATDNKGRTPLHLAARKRGNVPVCCYMMEQGRHAQRAQQGQHVQQQQQHPMYIRDGGGVTPLLYAARHQELAVVECMIRQLQRDVVNQEREGMEQRRQEQNLEMQSLVCPDSGASVLHYAIENSIDVLEYLATEYPFLLTARTQEAGRYMPIHLACHYCTTTPLANIVQLVEMAPHTLFATDAWGRTPLDIARQSQEEYQERQQLLLQSTSDNDNNQHYNASFSRTQRCLDNNGILAYLTRRSQSGKW